MKKEVFKEGTFWYNITYKVKKGQVKFIKVFWWGLLGQLIANLITAQFVGNPLVTIIAFGYPVGWLQSMWYSRKNVFHPLWFYAGFLLPIVWTIINIMYV